MLLPSVVSCGSRLNFEFPFGCGTNMPVKSLVFTITGPVDLNLNRAAFRLAPSLAQNRIPCHQAHIMVPAFPRKYRAVQALLAASTMCRQCHQHLLRWQHCRQSLLLREAQLAHRPISAKIHPVVRPVQLSKVRIEFRHVHHRRARSTANAHVVQC